MLILTLWTCLTATRTNDSVLPLSFQVLHQNRNDSNRNIMNDATEALSACEPFWLT